MIDILERDRMPALYEISDYVNNSLWDEFYSYLIKEYGVKTILEYSKCSWAPGWNIKLKRLSKTLCTLYPHEGFFKVLVVIGENEKEEFIKLLPELTKDLQDLYHKTDKGMGQCWLMIDLEDEGDRLEDIKKIVAIRRNAKRKHG